MSKTLHIGVFTSDPDDARLPDGYQSDGDSFLEWGEPTYGNSDVPVHIQNVAETWTAQDVEGVRQDLSHVLRAGERLTDYAVISDTDDWSVDVSVVTLEGAVTVDTGTIGIPPEQFFQSGTDVNRRLDRVIARIETYLDSVGG